MTAWRRHLHAHPETAFNEHATAAFVAERLASFNYAVDRGLAGTGVVGTLSTGPGPAVGLRADMDALPIEEAGSPTYRSTCKGRMHACGHDGHMAMLLGAAQYLAKTRKFSGTLHVIFQPAEENEAGGRRMVEDGLFERFPMRAVYGMHNWPGLRVGRFAVRAGPMMAACDLLEITLKGKGTHAAMPHLGSDVIVASAATVNALQTAVSRSLDPLDVGVVSITQIHAGDTWNVLPGTAVLRGTVRALREDVQDLLESRVKDLVSGIAAAHGCASDVRYERRYPVTINHPRETEEAAQAAVAVVGAENVLRDPSPSMGSEDFSFMLNVRPGCYIWIGNGTREQGASLHNPHYDFNDDILPIGASYWARLVESVLPLSK